MIGSLSKYLICVPVLLLVVIFFVVPLGETSGVEGIVVDVTPTPTPPPHEITTFSPITPIDISHLSSIPTRLTGGGCCPYAGWSSDSEWILFLDGEIDKVDPGLFTVPRAGGTASQLTNRYGIFSPDWSLVAYPENGQVFVERWADGNRWTIPSNGRAVSISNDLTHVAWEYGSQSIRSPDRRQKQVWISTITGESASELVTIHGGEFLGWMGGSEAILVTGRLAPPSPAGIWKIDTATGAGLLLFEVEKPRSITLSPSGEWMAFIVAFEQDTRRNGIWVVKTDGSFAKRLAGFGAYRWRSDGHLLLMPLDFNAQYPHLYQVDIDTGKSWKLIDPELTTLRIANNDWSISPNGHWLLYHSSEDRNLWVMELPELHDTP